VQRRAALLVDGLGGFLARVEQDDQWSGELALQGLDRNLPRGGRQVDHYRVDR